MEVMSEEVSYRSAIPVVSYISCRDIYIKKQGAYSTQVTATELQVKRANQIMYAHDIGFDISWRDFDRWHLRG